MNMKKTIAAIAAGAMAVSAMASSVSAIELKDTNVLSYSLVEKHAETVMGSVTISASLASIDTKSATGLTIMVPVPAGMKVKSITVTGYYGGSASTPIQPYTRVSDKNADNWAENIKNGYMTIPVSDKSAGSGSLLGDDNTTINVSVVFEHDKGKLSEINDMLSMFSIGATTDAALTYFPNGVYVDDGDGKFDADKDKTIKYWVDDTSTIKEYDNAKGRFYLPNADSSKAKDESNGAYNTSNVVASAFTAKGEKIYEMPFQTGPDGNENIAYYLQNAKVIDKDHSYTNVLPVINDAIANYGTVTFTFTTATQGIVYTVENPGTGEKAFDKIYGGTDGSYGPDGTFVDARQNANKYNWIDGKQVGGRLIGIYTSEWYGDKSYTSFTQHLYNGTGDIYGVQNGWSGFADENQNYYGGLWGDNNLFGGALVINENLTMRLSDVDMFTTYATKM